MAATLEAHEFSVELEPLCSGLIYFPALLSLAPAVCSGRQTAPAAARLPWRAALPPSPAPFLLSLIPEPNPRCSYAHRCANAHKCANSGKDVKKEEHGSAGGLQTRAVNAQVPQKTETRTSLPSCTSPVQGCAPQGAPWTSGFIAALCTMAKKPHQRS